MKLWFDNGDLLGLDPALREWLAVQARQIAEEGRSRQRAGWRLLGWSGLCVVLFLVILAAVGIPMGAWKKFHWIPLAAAAPAAVVSLVLLFRARLHFNHQEAHVSLLKPLRDAAEAASNSDPWPEPGTRLGCYRVESVDGDRLCVTGTVPSRGLAWLQLAVVALAVTTDLLLLRFGPGLVRAVSGANSGKLAIMLVVHGILLALFAIATLRWMTVVWAVGPIDGEPTIALHQRAFPFRSRTRTIPSARIDAITAGAAGLKLRERSGRTSMLVHAIAGGSIVLRARLLSCIHARCGIDRPAEVDLAIEPPRENAA